MPYCNIHSQFQSLIPSQYFKLRLMQESVKTQVQEYDDEDEKSCLNCFSHCFRPSKYKVRQYNDSKSSRDKLSMQQSHYQVNGAQEGPQKSQTSLFSNIREEFTGYQVPAVLASAKNSRSNKQPKELPKNKLFILKSKYPKCSIIAKLSEKQFRLNVDQAMKSSLTESIQPCERFKLIDRGIQSNTDSWKLATPEIIAKYIAQRVSGQSLVVDLGCGIGGNTIQFAKTADFVIGIEINYENLMFAKNNTRIYNVEEKVEFIYANLLNLKQLRQFVPIEIRANTVFINPTVKDVEKVDLLRDCSPMIYQVMEKALHIAPNIILQFPSNIDITQLPIIFDFQRYPFLQDKYLIQINISYPYNYTLEIEALVINKRIEYYIVYFGQVANIPQDETHKFLAQELLITGHYYNGINMEHRLLDVLNQIRILKGSYKMYQMAFKSIKTKTNESILQNFLDHVCSIGLVSLEQIKQFDQGYENSQEKNPKPSEYLSEQSQIRVPEPRMNPLLTRSGQKSAKFKGTTTPEDQLPSPSDYSFKSDNPLGSNPFSNSIIKRLGANYIKPDLLEYSMDDDQNPVMDFRQTQQDEI